MATTRNTFRIGIVVVLLAPLAFATCRRTGPNILKEAAAQSGTVTITITLNGNLTTAAVLFNGKPAKRIQVPSKKGQFFEPKERIEGVGTVTSEHKAQFLQVNPPCFNDFEGNVWCES